MKYWLYNFLARKFRDLLANYTPVNKNFLVWQCRSQTGITNRSSLSDALEKTAKILVNKKEQEREKTQRQAEIELLTATGNEYAAQRFDDPAMMAVMARRNKERERYEKEAVGTAPPDMPDVPPPINSWPEQAKTTRAGTEGGQIDFERTYIDHTCMDEPGVAAMQLTCCDDDVVVVESSKKEAISTIACSHQHTASTEPGVFKEKTNVQMTHVSCGKG